MGIILWLIFGALAGWIASILVGNNENQGWIGNIVIGIAGAFIGGSIARALGIGNGVDDFDLGSLLVAIGGACLLLFIVGAIRSNRNRG